MASKFILSVRALLAYWDLYSSEDVVNELTSTNVGFEGSRKPAVWYEASMPPRWGTSMVWVFGMMVVDE
jgi:hypothetical protein